MHQIFPHAAKKTFCGSPQLSDLEVCFLEWDFWKQVLDLKLGGWVLWSRLNMKAS